jgi:cytochrome d ubiquinol oxidase subunit I
MILAAYLVTGLLVASIHAVGMLRGRRDRIHRLGLLIPLTVACIATPIQFAVPDTAARAIAGRARLRRAPATARRTTRCCTGALDRMVGICILLIGLALWLVVAWWRRKDLPQTRSFLRATAVSGVAAVIAPETGWVVTEVGRRP